MWCASVWLYVKAFESFKQRIVIVLVFMSLEGGMHASATYTLDSPPDATRIPDCQIRSWLHKF